MYLKFAITSFGKVELRSTRLLYLPYVSDIKGYSSVKSIKYHQVPVFLSRFTINNKLFYWLNCILQHKEMLESEDASLKDENEELRQKLLEMKALHENETNENNNNHYKVWWHCFELFQQIYEIAIHAGYTYHTSRAL